jgi:hypothetical protein
LADRPARFNRVTDLDEACLCGGLRVRQFTVTIKIEYRLVSDFKPLAP